MKPYDRNKIEHAEEYAEIVYEAVRTFGWTFYRTGVN